MGAVLQQASVNLSNLVVDDIYVVVAKPGTVSVQGVNTGSVGIVGGAAWGPINVPVLLGSPGDVALNFGPLTVNPNDMPTDALLAMQQGVTQVYGVRVTDGTDVKATYTLFSAGAKATQTLTVAGTFHVGDILTAVIGGTSVAYTVVTGDISASGAATSLAAAINANPTVAALVNAAAVGAVVTLTANYGGTAGNAITTTASVGGGAPTMTLTAGGTTLLTGAAGVSQTVFTALYSGTEGNNIQITVVPGANWTFAAPTWTVRIARTGSSPQTEVYQNIPSATFTANLINYLANGQSVSRGPSQLVRAANGTTPNADPLQVASVPLVGGTNGDTTITSAQQLGSNTVTPESGMYSLISTGCQQFLLSGNTDTTSWANQIAYATGAGALAVLCLPANTSTTTAVATKKAVGADTVYAVVVKDWIQFNDTYNNSLRLISPGGFVLGRIASLAPHQSPGNKPINGIIATERTIARQPYTAAELAQLFTAGIMVVTNPLPGGAFFGLRHGLNASSDNTINGVEYTRMTNFLAYSFAQSFGVFIDQLQSAQPDDPVRNAANISLNNFLAGLKNPNNRMIDDFFVDMSFGPGKVNDAVSVSQGFMKAKVMVKYLATIRYFVVTLVGGKTVTVTPQ